MAKVCEICNKKKHIGHTRKLLRGHYNVTGRRSFRPNLQKTIFQGRHLLACVRCLHTLQKAGKVQ